MVFMVTRERGRGDGGTEDVVSWVAHRRSFHFRPFGLTYRVEPHIKEDVEVVYMVTTILRWRHP